ncbi:hypothetical protein [Desulfoferula mesophila]|uniref:Uncharacterized protein n=1 Tax=Desulfoferula mesophila TaxID=3058419 RepID=A0AAU9ED37_9BACT|nr:hypothetical protein FAK_20590 [Desulfoferula mesophilus]
MSQFSKHIIAEIDRIAKREKLSKSVAFLFWFGVTFLGLSETEAREATSVEGSNDKGVDLFFVDQEQGIVHIAQGKYSESQKL